jgi:hypothetical protein
MRCLGRALAVFIVVAFDPHVKILVLRGVGWPL